MNRNGRVVKCLIVGVAEHEGYIVDAFAIHVVDSIAATASYTNHLDDAFLSFWLAEVEQYVIIHTILIFVVLISKIGKMNYSSSGPRMVSPNFFSLPQPLFQKEFSFFLRASSRALFSASSRAMRSSSSRL